MPLGKNLNMNGWELHCYGSNLETIIGGTWIPFNYYRHDHTSLCCDIKLRSWLSINERGPTEVSGSMSQRHRMLESLPYQPQGHFDVFPSGKEITFLWFCWSSSLCTGTQTQNILLLIWNILISKEQQNTSCSVQTNIRTFVQMPGPSETFTFSTFEKAHLRRHLFLTQKGTDYFRTLVTNVSLCLYSDLEQKLVYEVYFFS